MHAQPIAPPPPAWPYRLPLRNQKGAIIAWTLVDQEDYVRLWDSYWQSHLGRYATGRYQGRKVLLHRLVMGLAIGEATHIDHINGDGLDNRKANLRYVTHAQNMQNRTSQRGSTSQYRGVYWDATRGKWSARVYHKGVNHCLGRFDDEHEAGRVAAAFRARLMTHAVDR